MTTHTHKSFAEMATEVIVTFLNNNQIELTELPQLIRSVHASMRETLGNGHSAEELSEPVKLVDHTAATPELIPPRPYQSARIVETRRRPALPVEKSVTGDYVYCLECGKRFKTMKHHLMLEHDMTPEQYRAEWKLPHDWPITAPNHSENRRKIARGAGLGSRITSR